MVPESNRKKLADGSEISFIDKITKCKLQKCKLEKNYESLTHFMRKMNEMSETNNHECGWYHRLSETEHSNDDGSIELTE